MSNGSFPATIAQYMAEGRSAAYTNKIRYHKDIYKILVFENKRADIVKVPRIGEHAAVALGAYPTPKGTVELYARSIGLDRLRKTVEQRPYTMILASPFVVDGVERFRTTTALAFSDMDDVHTLTIQLLRKYLKWKAIPDRQVSRLYDWEHMFLVESERGDNGHQMFSDKKLQRVALDVIESFNLPQDRIFINTAPLPRPPKGEKVKVGLCKTIRDDRCAKKPIFAIVNVHDATLDTLLHELAHLVVFFQQEAGSLQNHGAEFCGVYAHLLSQFGSFREKMVIRSMRDSGLKVLPYEA